MTNHKIISNITIPNTQYVSNKLQNGENYRFKGKLSSLVDCVFIETYFSKPENQGVVNRIVPDNTVELILTNKKFERKFSNEAENNSLQSHLSGLKTKWQDIKLEGSPIISIRFRPELIYQLSDITAVECRNKAISGKDFFGPTFPHFEDELFSLDNTFQRLILIDKYFSSKLLKSDIKIDKLYHVAKHKIDRSLGNLRISNLAAELEVNQKSLENKFNKFIGITPKQYSRLVRFIATVKNYSSSNSSFTKYAYENMYSDQSHFVKEIKEFTGFSPSNYFTTSKGIQEDIF